MSRGADLGYTICDQKWRYAKWPDGEELYDLTIDPHERENLALFEEFGPKLIEMRGILAGRRAEAIRQRQPL